MSDLKKGKLIITKGQYNRVFASNLINESQIPTVKGGANRVEKAFKREGITENEEMGGGLRSEVQELVSFLYRKSEALSPFWAENGVTYEEIIDALTNAKLIINKDGLYGVTKTNNSAEETLSAIEQALQGLIGGGEEADIELEEDELGNPSTQPQRSFNRELTSQNKQFQVVGMNQEFAIVNGSNETYVFDYHSVDQNLLKNYADVEVTSSMPNGEDSFDTDYADDFDIDEQTLTNFLNDNFDSLKSGRGAQAWDSGVFNIVLVDDELRQDLIALYDKDPMVTKRLGQVSEEEDGGMDAMNKFKAGSQRAFVPSKNASNPNDNSAILAKIKAIRAKELASRQPISSEPELDETTSCGSAGGDFTAPMSGGGVMKRELPNTPVVMEDDSLGQGYTHFAIVKTNNQIATGWDYTGEDNTSIKEYAKMDLINDFPDMKVSDFLITTRKKLESKGIDVTDTNNWFKNDISETSTVASAGNFQYDTPGGLTMDLGKNNPKSKAEKVTQYAGGSFVDFNDCTKLNNKVSATGCSQGAVDGVVKTRKTTGNVNAPSLNENKIFEEISAKTGRSIDEIKALIAQKKK